MNDSNQRKFGLNRDTIKLIAVIAMVLNHIGTIFLEPGTIWHEMFIGIGYFTAITMIYFLIEGYEYTRSPQKYAQRLCLFAVVSQLPFNMAFAKDGIFDFLTFNMIFTLLCCFGIIYIMKEKMQEAWAKTAIILLILATTYSDWGVLAPMFTILFLQAGKNKKALKKAWFYCALLFGMILFLEGMEKYVLLINLIRALGLMIPLLLSGVCILKFYNGKKAQRGSGFYKWFFYWFYPGHLFVLGLIRLTLNH